VGGAAHRNRTDDLRITRRITAVQHGPPVCVCPLNRLSPSSGIHGDPASLLANPLARSSAGVILCAHAWADGEQSLTMVPGT
jgi:hypothetical protein